MAWFDSLIAWDSETTGFGPDARIIEIGIVVFEDAKPVHEYSHLLNPPGVDYENAKVKEALAVNKIELASLRGMPTFADILPDLFVEFTSPVWVGHNQAFDIKMLKQELARTATPNASFTGDGFLWNALQLCTCNLARFISKTRKGNKLGEVAARYGITPSNAHRATADAITSGLILHQMLARGEVPRDDAAMHTFMAEADKWSATW